MGLHSSRFKHIILYEDNRVVWSLDGQFTEEFGAGALFAGEFCLNLLGEEGKAKNYSLKATDRGGDRSAFDLQKNFTTKVEGNKEDILKNVGINQVCPYLRFAYNIPIIGEDNILIVNYKTPAFIQGMLTILNAFNVDYRRMMLACSIKVSMYDGKYIVKYYQIQGYPLPYFPIENNGKFIPAENPVPTICSTYFNPPDKIIPNMEQRLASVRNHLMEKWNLPPDLLEEHIDNIMSEIPELLLYIPPERDNEMTDRYVGIRGEHIGDGNYKVEINRLIEERF